MPVRVPRGPCPVFIRQTLKYSEYGVTFNPGAAGVPAVYVFSANGLFDPNITGVGHQPRGFDQWSAFYGLYSVKASRITVMFAATGSEAYNTICGVAPIASSSALTGPNDYIEQEFCAFDIMRPGTSGNRLKMSNSVDICKWYNLSRVTDDDTVSGDSTQNPTRQVYFHVWAAALEATDPQQIDASIVIEYDVYFTRPLPITQS